MTHMVQDTTASTWGLSEMATLPKILECFRTFQKPYPEFKNWSRLEKCNLHYIFESIHKAPLDGHKLNLSRHILHRDRTKVGFPWEPLGVTLSD